MGEIVGVCFVGIIHDKIKMHITSPTSPGALDVVARDDSTNYVTPTYPSGCVSHVEKTKSKAYLILLGSHDLMGNISKIKHRYSKNQESISNLLNKEE